eukprot:2568477-Rhodomonas_salina.2
MGPHIVCVPFWTCFAVRLRVCWLGRVEAVHFLLAKHVVDIVTLSLDALVEAGYVGNVLRGEFRPVVHDIPHSVATLVAVLAEATGLVDGARLAVANRSLRGIELTIGEDVASQIRTIWVGGMSTGKNKCAQRRNR